MYLAGFILMAWNLIMTAKSGKAVDGTAEVLVLQKSKVDEPKARSMIFSPPFVLTAAFVVLIVAAGFGEPVAAFGAIVLALCLGIAAVLFKSAEKPGEGPTWHRILEGRALLFSVLTVVAVLAGGIAEIIPAVVAGPSAIKSETAQPYTALEIEGRDVYLSEGCYTCHSQMIRPFLWETARYGEISMPEESVFDHPFQWGSRRIGPDLARVGAKGYPALWHYEHMLDPRATTPGSNMPPYSHLAENTVDFSETDVKLRAMRSVGVPYSPVEIQGAKQDALAQADEILKQLAEQSEGRVELARDSQLVALIAYLQRLGNPPKAAAPEGDAAAGETAADSQEASADDAKETK
jgi:cytochrome c oxidase cbb3-type subunit I/II